MFTIRAGRAALGVGLLLLATGCSREQQDWRSAEAADTIESYDQFIHRHPDSELVTEARTRVAQLGEERDWREAGSLDTAAAYKQFLSQHPSGKWAQEARIRIESFALGAPSAAGAASVGALAAQAAGDDQASDSRTDPQASAPMAAEDAVSGRLTPATVSAAPGPGQHVPATGSAMRAPPPVTPGASTGEAASRPAAGVQLGAFSTEAGARTQWKLLSGRFGPDLDGLTAHVVAVDTASGRLYRLQAMGVDESGARTICERLKKRAQPCVPVLAH